MFDGAGTLLYYILARIHPLTEGSDCPSHVQVLFETPFRAMAIISGVQCGQSTTKKGMCDVDAFLGVHPDAWGFVAPPPAPSTSPPNLVHLSRTP